MTTTMERKEWKDFVERTGPKLNHRSSCPGDDIHWGTESALGSNKAMGNVRVNNH